MCLLYRLDKPAAAIAKIFGARRGNDPWDGGYAAPGRPAPLVVRDMRDGMRYIRPAFWGVPPPPRATGLVSNVRNLDSPFWIGTLRHPEMRCLIPATCFAEWSGPTGAKRQHWFSLSSSPVFAMAGIIRETEDAPTFAMLTTDANRLVGHYHPQSMPALIHAEDYETWLSADWKVAKSLVASFPGQLMQVGDAPPPPEPETAT